MTSRNTKILLAATGCVAIAVAAVLLFTALIPGARKEYVVKIARGADFAAVEDSLRLHFGDAYASKVMRLARLEGFEPEKRHGAYLIAKGMSPLKASLRLSRGGQYPVRLTINGFRSREDLVRSIASRFDFSPEALDSVLSDRKFLTTYGLLPSQAMGLFLNDTYEFYWTASPQSVLTKIGDSYRHFWNPERSGKARSLGLTAAEVGIISSITDEETNVAAEKGQVGRLYINRLQKGMRLQADPTVKFAVGDFSLKRITSKHLAVNSPYNTYRVNGLPPGAIRTLSRATIDSILNSSPSDYLYMCASPDFSGRHVFARTFEEHKVNADAYRRELDRRGF